MRITLPNGIVVDNISPAEFAELGPLVEQDLTHESFEAPKGIEEVAATEVDRSGLVIQRLVVRQRQNGDSARLDNGDILTPRGLSDKLREVYSVIVEYGPIHIGEIAELMDIPKEKVSSRLHLLLNQHKVIERVRAGVYQAKA